VVFALRKTSSVITVLTVVIRLAGVLAKALVIELKDYYYDLVLTRAMYKDYN
jgi:hypothetical protein